MFDHLTEIMEDVENIHKVIKAAATEEEMIEI